MAGVMYVFLLFATNPNALVATIIIDVFGTVVCELLDPAAAKACGNNTCV